MKGTKMKNSKVVITVIVLGTLLVGSIFMSSLFKIEEQSGAVSACSDIPYIGEHLALFPSDGEVEYVSRKGRGACIVFWAGRISDPENSDYFKDSLWITMDATGYETQMESVGNYEIASSSDDVVFFKPLIDKQDEFQFTVYYMPNSQVFIGKAISSRPD